MKIKCGGCDWEEAQVFCCADEAALCLRCDKKIHTANEFVSKHQRVSLSPTSSSSPRPKCDICQVRFSLVFLISCTGSDFFFCYFDVLDRLAK